MSDDPTPGRGAESRLGSRALQQRQAGHVLRREEGPQGRGLPDLVSEPRRRGSGRQPCFSEDPGIEVCFESEERLAVLVGRRAWGRAGRRDETTHRGGRAGPGSGKGVTVRSVPGTNAESRWTGFPPPGSRSLPRKRKPGPSSGTLGAPKIPKVVTAHVPVPL